MGGQRLCSGGVPALQGAGHPPLEVGGHAALRDRAPEIGRSLDSSAARRVPRPHQAAFTEDAAAEDGAGEACTSTSRGAGAVRITTPSNTMENLCRKNFGKEKRSGPFNLLASAEMKENDVENVLLAIPPAVNVLLEKDGKGWTRHQAGMSGSARAPQP